MLFAAMDPKVLAAARNVFWLAAPEIVLLAAACAIYVGGTFRRGKHLWGAAALASLVVAAIVSWSGAVPGASERLSPLLPDKLAYFVKALAWIGGAAILLLSWNEVKDESAAEFHASLLLLIAGVSLVGAANELITLFLSLELISIPTYILLYLPRSGAREQEAAIKYFLLSVFSSALLLFGFSYLYGIAGTTNLSDFYRGLAQQNATTHPSMFKIAFVLIVAGLGFRITAVPFHFYAPDVFQGAPISLAALLAFVPKVAGFTALVRVMGYSFSDLGLNLVSHFQLSMLFWILAIITMTTGNVLALLQNNLKRLLAYSSIAHGGYMLVGLAASPELAHGGSREGWFASLTGTDATFFYLVAYGAMTLGAFAVITYFQSADRPVETVDDLAGAGRSHPALALTLGLFLLSLIGIPLTAGFAGKLLLFFSAVGVNDPANPESRQLFLALAVIGALNAAIGAYYYLRILAAMFLRDPVRPLETKPHVPALATAAICAFVTLVAGVYPDPLLHAAREATAPSTAITSPADSGR